MALQQSFNDLVGSLKELLDSVLSLIDMLEPEPMRDEPYLVRQLLDFAMDLEGPTRGAIAAATDAVVAAAYPQDLERLRQRLIEVQRAHNEMTRTLVADLLAPSNLGELVQLGVQRADLRRWTDKVIDLTARCSESLFGVSDALFACWQEMVERIGMNSISVQTKAVGQEISVPASELREVVERVG